MPGQLVNFHAIGTVPIETEKEKYIRYLDLWPLPSIT